MFLVLGLLLLLVGCASTSFCPTNNMKQVTPVVRDGLTIVSLNDNLTRVELRGDRLLVNDPQYLLPPVSWEVRETWAPTDARGWNRQDPRVILSHQTNGQCNQAGAYGTLFGAFLEAYNTHRDVTLVPDDVWLTIQMKFAGYVADNAEALRGRFVDHDGKKKLSVMTYGELLETQWDEFFSLIIHEITANTKDGVVDTLSSDFSTTTPFHRVVSTAAIMSTFKHYFTYVRGIPLCGIRNVRFAGTLEDWTRIVDKLVSLKAYDVGDGKWTGYVTALLPVLQQFVAAFQGTVDTEFWDKVMNLKRGSLGSGSTTKVSGWILAFYGQGGKEVDIDDIDQHLTVQVPVVIDNKRTGVKKTVHLDAKFSGLMVSDDSIRPQLSMIVWYDPGEATPSD
jgi:hypothetical protein